MTPLSGALDHVLTGWKTEIAFFLVGGWCHLQPTPVPVAATTAYRCFDAASPLPCCLPERSSSSSLIPPASSKIMTLPQDELHEVTPVQRNKNNGTEEEEVNGHNNGAGGGAAGKKKGGGPSRRDVRHKTPYDNHEELVWLMESPPASGVLTQDGVTQIAFHQYTPGTYTWLDTKLNPLWTALTECLPKRMAPNLVTALGGLHCLFAYLITWRYMPDFQSTPPTWILVLNCYCNVIYYTLDCMDGKQARRTNSSSPLGQLFDHGVDCLCLLTHLSMVQAWYQAPPRTYLAIQSSLQFSFFVAQWEEYYTGVLPHATGNVGVTEVNYGLALASLINAGFDHGPVYSTILTDAFYDSTILPRRFVDVIAVPFCKFLGFHQLRDVMAAGWYFMVSMLIVLSVVRVWQHVTPPQRVPAILKFVSPCLACWSWTLVPNSILSTQLRYVSIGLGLTLCLITGKLIVFSMARQAYAVIQWDVAPLVLVSVLGSRDTRWTLLGMTRLWQWVGMWYLIRIIQWNRSAIHQICTRLHIRLFVLQPVQAPPKSLPNSSSSSSSNRAVL